MALERWSSTDVKYETFGAVREIHPKGHSARRVHADTEAVAGMHAIEIELLFIGEHFPRIEKKSKVHKRHDLPPILRRDIETARVAKAPFTIAPDRLGTAKRLHQVERNFFSAIGYGLRRVEAQRQDAALPQLPLGHGSKSVNSCTIILPNFTLPHCSHT